MKTINAIGQVFKFKNEELYKAYCIAKALGYKVHTFKTSSNIISQIFIDNGKTFGTVQAAYSSFGLNYGTCHKPATGIGSGFGLTGLSNESLAAKIEYIQNTLLFCPDWVTTKDRKKVVKLSWAEYLTKENILRYFEI